MRIMALDASISSTGYAIYDTIIGDYVKADKIRTSIKKITPTRAKRVDYICMEISHLLFWEAVDVVLIEDIYIGMQQPSSVIPLAILRGAIQETVYGLEYDDLFVTESSKIKKAVVGNGNASKEDVYNELKRKYAHSKVVMEALGDKLMTKDNKDKNEDISDAIALIDAYLSSPSIVHPA